MIALCLSLIHTHTRARTHTHLSIFHLRLFLFHIRAKSHLWALSPPLYEEFSAGSTLIISRTVLSGVIPHSKCQNLFGFLSVPYHFGIKGRVLCPPSANCFPLIHFIISSPCWFGDATFQSTVVGVISYLACRISKSDKMAEQSRSMQRYKGKHH